MAQHLLFVASSSSHPWALLALGLPVRLADGQDFHVPIIEPFHRLDILFPPTAVLMPYSFNLQE